MTRVNDNGILVNNDGRNCAPKRISQLVRFNGVIFVLLRRRLGLIIAALCHALQVEDVRATRAVHTFQDEGVGSQVVFRVKLYSASFRSVTHVCCRQRRRRTLFVRLQRFIHYVHVLREVGGLKIVVAIFATFCVERKNDRVQ